MFPLSKAFSAVLVVSLFGMGSAQTTPQTPAPTPVPVDQMATYDARYILGPEDLVTVSVLRHPEFSGDFLIPPSGVIDLPGVGQIQATGLSLGQLRHKVAASLGKTHLLHPEVNASIRSARLQRVYVVGDVRQPGAFDLKPGWGIMQGIAAASGLDPDVQRADVHIVLEHGSAKNKIEAELTDVLRDEDNPKYVLLSGDTLRVEAKSLIPIYVSGRVKTPGLYNLREDSADVLAAIAQAGGVQDDASFVVKIERSKGTEQLVDLTHQLVQSLPSGSDQGQPMPSPPVTPEERRTWELHSGDMVIVEQSIKNFSVLGFVSKPGYFPIPEGHIFRLSDAIAMAQGETAKKGRISRIAIVRDVDGKRTRSVYNLDLYMKKGDLSQNPVIRTGDLVYVPQNNSVETTLLLAGATAAALVYEAFKR